MKEVKVIKIGGNIVDNPVALEDFITKFSTLEGPKVLIHGGGVMASQMSKQLGIETTMINGRRVTDIETLKVVTMVYAGWCNKMVVSKLQSVGCNSCGLCGADCNVIPAKMRAKEPIDFGYVGDVDPTVINISALKMFIESGITPVMCAITHDANGSLLNTNADTIASSIAQALAVEYSVKLIYCFEKNGVLADKDDDNSVINLITRESFASLLADGVVEGGMIPKLENAFSAIDNGVSEVIIKHAKNLNINIQTTIK